MSLPGATVPDRVAEAAVSGVIAPPVDADREARVRRHWQVNRRVAALMLTAWFLVTFVAMFFARDLQFSVFGWPFSFWIAAQGALLVYLLLVWWYARLMRRLDDASGVTEDD